MEQTMLYSGLNELISLCYFVVEKKGYDTDFLDSVAAQYKQRGRLSDKQIAALENIAKKELDKRREMEFCVPLFNDPDK